jgi:ribosomal protein L37E
MQSRELPEPEEIEPRDDPAIPWTTGCRGCGTIAYSIDRYCSCCGRPLPRRCRSCGAEIVHPLANYCSSCGAPAGDNRRGSTTG